MKTEVLNKCRGRKLVGIRKYREDPYIDYNSDGLILEFSNGHIIHIVADCNVYNGATKLIIMNEAGQERYKNENR